MSKLMDLDEQTVLRPRLIRFGDTAYRRMDVEAGNGLIVDDYSLKRDPRQQNLLLPKPFVVDKGGIFFDVILVFKLLKTTSLQTPVRRSRSTTLTSSRLQISIRRKKHRSKLYRKKGCRFVMMYAYSTAKPATKTTTTMMI